MVTVERIIKTVHFLTCECADCAGVIVGQYYSGERVCGKQAKYAHSAYWWLCEQCALARGWIW